MIKKLTAVVVVLLFFASCNKKQELVSLLSPGISLDLATYRKQQVSDVVYTLLFHIPKDKNEAIASKLDLELQIHDLKHPLYLDFNVDSSHLKHVVVNSDTVPIDHQQEHLIITQEYLKQGENNIHVDFDAGELSLNKNENYLYTLLVPDRASTLFPCFDQPDIKAHYNLSISAPKDWEVLSSAYVDKRRSRDGFVNYTFETSDKMSTYLFSFVAGDFKQIVQVIDGVGMKMLYREDNADKIKASTDAIFKLHYDALVFLEGYANYEFPFQKLDFAAIPGFQYGGMEHVGAIQYRESSLFLDSTATQNKLLNRSRLIAHETAHMWFGDLVTMKWFDDVWLKEVFANFLADKITSESFPEVNHRLNFMVDNYLSAYSEDRTKGATPIKQHLDNLKNAGALYGRIIYNKAPIMMRQLEALVGKKAFRKGVRNYIKVYADSNADWSDLITILGGATPENLIQWSDIWVYKAGRPVISDAITYKNGDISSFYMYQKAENGESHVWRQKFKIGLIYEDCIRVIPVNLKARKQKISTLIGLPKSKSIIYNYDALGYGVFPIKHLDVTDIPAIKDEVARGYAYINLYENMLSGKVNPEKVLEVLKSGISKEDNELILGVIQNEMSTIFWNYITEKQRTSLGSDLESVVWKRLQRKEDGSGIKKMLFDLYQDIAYSEDGKDRLYRIWNKLLKIEGLNLNTQDFTSLATTLVIYKHPKAATILQNALEQISNTDIKERFKFLLSPLSADESIRDNFVLSLKKPENREKERWVTTALHYINHPLRQDSSQKHLKLYLELLEEIQLTGDIFFPKSWLNATIGKYSSDYAHDALEHFLKENPDFPEVLKNKLLQSADGIYRAKLIQNTDP
ncbi:M1 family aminopeptidase [Flavobacteriaceae bacterium MHTCC 0001]